MCRRPVLVSGLLALAVLMIATVPRAFGQQPALPRLPPQVEPRPGVPLTLPTVPEKAPPRVRVAPLAGGAPAGADQIKVDFKGLLIEGATVYSTDELEAFYRELIGTQITLARIFQIAEQIQAKYHADGYLITRVVVPAQSAAGGIFRVQVIEGFVSSISVEGDIGGVRERIEAQLQPIIGERPVNTRTLERYLLLANDVPGITLRGVLRPGVGEVGASELVVQVDRKPFDGFVVVNNRGSKFTGAWRTSVSFRKNASTWLGESIGVILGKSEANEQNFLQLTYSQNVGNDGVTFNAIASYGRQTPGFTLKSLDIETESLFGRGSFTYPWIRSRRKNVFLNAGFDAIRSDVETLGVQTSQDQLRVLHGTATTDLVDRFGVRSTFSLGIRQGLPILGASENGTLGRSRVEGVNDFTLFNAGAARRQPLFGDVALWLTAKGQYSFDTLLSDEECRLGGERFGRGYDPSEIAGEDCLAFTAELQYSGRNPFPPPTTLLPGFQAYAFYDVGAVWNSDTLAEPKSSLASAGIGIRLQVVKDLFLDFEIAKPLTREVATEGNKDARAFFQALARF